jgi:hypothetical protein
MEKNICESDFFFPSKQLYMGSNRTRSKLAIFLKLLTFGPLTSVCVCVCFLFENQSVPIPVRKCRIKKLKKEEGKDGN